MKLVKISDKEQLWINPRMINGIFHNPLTEPPTTHITTNWYKYQTELSVEEVFKRIGVIEVREVKPE